MLRTSRRAHVGGAALALLLLLAALLALCAFPGDRPADGDELRARADAVCLTAHQRLGALDPLDSPAHVAASGPVVVATTLDAARRLLELDADGDRATALRRYAAHLVRQADLASRLQSAARTGDRARAVALIGALTANGRAGRRLGLVVSPGCGGITRPAPAGPAEAV